MKTDWKKILPLPHVHSGKVREMFSIPGNDSLLLMLATDRISTHDEIHLSEIPQKGMFLNALTAFWDSQVLIDVPTHIVATGRKIYSFLPSGNVYPDDLHLRSMIVFASEVVPVEFIYRSYLAGSLYKAYAKGSDPYGNNLPAGLQKMDHFNNPLFTPTEKSMTDPPLDSQWVRSKYRHESLVTKRAYEQIAQYLQTRGIVLVDGKFEAAGAMLVDEFGTGDCCRMAFARDIAIAQQYGDEVAWLDKQVARDYAEAQWDEKEKYPLTFSPVQIENIKARYELAFSSITDIPLIEWQKKFLD